jgi:hypothetical protein
MMVLRSCSVRRYRVEGDVPSPRDEAFVRRLADRRFLPLSAREERAYGWVSADNLLVTDFEAAPVLVGDGALFALRVDRRRVSARLLKARLDLDLEARRKAALDAGRPPRVTREERQELRAHLHGELLQRTSPSVDATPVLYHPRRREVLFLSLSRPVNELMRALWRDTFEADLVPLTPWRRGNELVGLDASRTGVGSRAADLDALERTDFTRGMTGARGTAPAALGARTLDREPAR